VSRTLAGRGVAAVGIAAGLVALGLTLVRFGGTSAHYADRGAAFAFLLVALSFASYLPAEVGRDTPAAVAGTVAFGFYLFSPAAVAFNQLNLLGAGGWLGLATVLVPLGALMVRSGEHATDEQRSPVEARRDPLLGLAALGAVLVAVGVWLPIFSGEPSVWNASASGHALGLLVLLAAVLNGVVLAGQFVSGAISRYAALLVTGASFGLLVAPFVDNAFSSLDSLGAGSWLLAIGGLLSFGGLLGAPLGARRRAALAAQPTV